MYLRNFIRNSFLIKQTKNEHTITYELPQTYKIILEADLNGMLQRITAKKGDKILVSGTNGAGKTRLFLNLINDYKAQVFLESNNTINPSEASSVFNQITETILLRHDEFLSVTVYMEQVHNIMPGTILDNLFMDIDNKDFVISVLKKYPTLHAELFKYIETNQYFYNDTTPYLIKQSIVTFRALFLAERRNILLLDSPHVKYLPEIFQNNTEKVIIVAGIYNSEERERIKFDKIYAIKNNRYLDNSDEEYNMMTDH